MENTEKTEEKNIKKRRGMTIPNMLTLFRIILIPLMIIIYYVMGDSPYLFNVVSNGTTYCLSWKWVIIAIIFFVAGFTDFFDGMIARKYNLITTFGKFADPLADKMLVFSSMTLLVVTVADGLPYGPLVPVWCFVIMLIREFMVSGIRMLAASRGEVIAAGWLGKWKTFITMVAIWVLFFYQTAPFVLYAGQVLMYISCLLTLLSGAEYLWNSRKIVFESI
ncbi:MAG: CDP-diacylglycerol--glycerol-3-phosphate 3-phosphatidyltransferase [Acholeplasmatales bacterium]|nr:CDP-diacylglycerol--glycerol-3-phosphate 3-phosphatidyltransferase [Acholeplasmatales bacterium]